MFSIGQMSKLAKVKVTTIRYYEQMELLDEPERSNGNQRRYTKPQLERLSFIRHARELGLTISQIRELVELSRHPDAPCENADRIATDHLATIRGKIKKLKLLEKELKRITTQCHANTVDACYVIQALSDHALCDAEH